MIPFVKAHACGNDFLVIQEDLAGIEARDDLTRRLCHRNDGIGADGVEFLTWGGERRGAIRLHNVDGSVAEISGNEVAEALVTLNPAAIIEGNSLPYHPRC